VVVKSFKVHGNDDRNDLVMYASGRPDSASLTQLFLLVGNVCQAESDTSEIGENVRKVITQSCLKFDGDLKNKEDMECLVDEQMNVFRRIFKVPAQLGDDGWIRVSKQLLKLYRTGRLGRFTLDPVPEVDRDYVRFENQ
jgi:hypothetical protein